MFCLGEFVDNQYTIEGTSLHDRVHTVGQGNREETWQVRAIWLRSEQYRLIGKADLVEVSAGQWSPVEYKRGKKGEFDNDELQVCAQALCLEEMTGERIEVGYIYYARSHQRQLVELTDELRGETIQTIAAVVALFETGRMPQAVESKRCRGCSLFEQCLPQVEGKMLRYREVI
jgi:CRISPR-associated exonuclease Cas4